MPRNEIDVGGDYTFGTNEWTRPMNRITSWPRRVAALALAGAVVMALIAPAALATPPDHVLDRAREAVAEGRQAVEQIEEGPSTEEKATGLDRAAEAIEAAAARKADREATEFPGNGRALGRGHSAEVHAILAAGGSPSELPSHGETVSGMAKAFDKLKADHPGRGQGLTKEKPPKGSDDASDD